MTRRAYCPWDILWGPANSKKIFTQGSREVPDDLADYLDDLNERRRSGTTNQHFNAGSSVIVSDRPHDPVPDTSINPLAISDSPQTNDPEIVRVNINTADIALMASALPGIGRSAAGKIADVRAQQPFETIDEVKTALKGYTAIDWAAIAGNNLIVFTDEDATPIEST